MSNSLHARTATPTRLTWWAAAAVAIITAAAYLPTCSYALTNWDDPHYTAGNPYVQRPGLTALVPIWTRVFEPVPVESGYYQPLTLTSLMFDAWLASGRPTWQPVLFHLTNTLLHAVNAMLVCMLVTRLVSSQAAGVVAGLLFGLHPINVEAVAWVASRKTVLAGTFALLSLLAYTEYALRQRRRHYWLSLAAFTLSLTAKPMAISIALVLLLLDFWPFHSLSWRRVAEKLPFLLIGIGWGVLAAVIQARNFPLKLGTDVRAAPLEIGYQLWIYARRIVWPSPLFPYYTAPHVWDWRQVVQWLPILGVAGVVVLVVCLRRVRPLVVSVAAYLVILAPALGLVKHTSVIAADRFGYLAMAGLMIGVGALAAHWQARAGSSARRLAGAGFLIALTLMTVFVTIPQQRIWRDSRSLWTHVLRHAPHQAIPNAMYANALVEAGRPLDALRYFDRAIEIRPEYFNAHLNYGITLHRLGRIPEAEPRLRRAIELQASAKAYAALGSLLLDQRRIPDAVAAFRDAVEADAEDFDAHFGLGTALQASRRHEEAIREYELADRHRPNDVGVLNNTAQSLMALGRLEEAAAALEKARRIAPAHPVVLASLRDLEAARARRSPP